MYNFLVLFTLISLFFAFMLSRASLADEQLFGYVQVSEIIPQVTAQVYQWAPHITGKFDGTYIGRDSNRV